MFKNRIKAIKFGFLLVCILPTISQALDKDDLLKYLLKSSYPEVKVIDKDEEKNEDIDVINNNEKKQDEETSNNKDSGSDEEEFVNVYVGEENKPQTEEEKEATTITESNYTNNLRITKDNPQILVYHSHSSETYSDSPDNDYHSSKDKEHSVMEVGSLLTNELSKRGWGVMHNTQYNDLDYNKSYVNSSKLVKSALSSNDSIKITIDLHRNGLTLENSEAKKKAHDKSTIEINGETVAKFLFVVGQRNENVDEIRKEAEELTALAEKKYPGLVEPVITKQYGRFNQYLAEDGLLIEIGNNATSTQEAKAACKYVAEVLDEYYKDKK